ncbi:MAG TPA: CorA family divalent cation transporter [Dysgonamonadaceae bacterium]|nr:CorA family divalent cation transporter [Dysgonamonadaceae bacterium]
MSKRIQKFDNFEWIDLENPTEEEIRSTSIPFQIDENFVEDALELGHLPKIERTPEYVFIILRAYTAAENEKVAGVQQISNKVAFFIDDKTLITIHRPSFKFIENTPTNFKSPDDAALYLFNELLMTYDEPIRKQVDKMDAFEQDIFLRGGSDLSVEKLYFEKSKARLTKKILLITQNVFDQLRVDDSLASTLQDLKDTILHLILRSEEMIDDATSLLNSHMTFTAQKNNDVMKLLTVFSAFFLPLTFIVGVYGMNFVNMPELKWENGYFIALLVMLVIALFIFVWFKRKKIL